MNKIIKQQNIPTAIFFRPCCRRILSLVRNLGVTFLTVTSKTGCVGPLDLKFLIIICFCHSLLTHTSHSSHLLITCRHYQLCDVGSTVRVAPAGEDPRSTHNTTVYWSQTRSLTIFHFQFQLQLPTV